MIKALLKIFQSKIGMMKYDDPNDCYSDFIFRLEGCVNRHAPLKKKLNVKEKKKVS